MASKKTPKNAPISAPPDINAKAGGKNSTPGGMSKNGPNSDAAQGMSKSTKAKIPAPKAKKAK